MRDRLGLAAWWNRPLANPTQTRYKRFVTLPGSELKSRFSDSKADFAATLRDALKTHYKDIEQW